MECQWKLNDGSGCGGALSEMKVEKIAIFILKTQNKKRAETTKIVKRMCALYDSVQ